MAAILPYQIQPPKLRPETGLLHKRTSPDMPPAGVAPRGEWEPSVLSGRFATRFPDCIRATCVRLTLNDSRGTAMSAAHPVECSSVPFAPVNQDRMKRYEKLADQVAELIRSGVLAPGEKVPSVRHASRTYGVSP